MTRKAPAVTFWKFLNLLSGHLRIPENKGWDYAILGTVGILVVVLFIFGVLTWSTTNSKVQYTPADVVYGEKIHAVHDSSSDNQHQITAIDNTNAAQKPEIRLSEKFYDFGEVNGDQVLTRTFVIANSGHSPLVIQRAYTTCGCTVADFTANEIPPGKVVLMILHFNTGYHDMRGSTIRREVMIETNDPDNPTLEIWIQASIR